MTDVFDDIPATTDLTTPSDLTAPNPSGSTPPNLAVPTTTDLAVPGSGLTPDFSNFAEVPSLNIPKKDPVALPHSQTKIKIKIRPMKYTDLWKVMSLNVLCLPENYPEQIWKKWMETGLKYSVVCEYAGQVAGYAFAVPSTVTEDGKVHKLKLVSFAVHPKLRGMGLGSAMLTHVQNFCKPVVLQVRAGNSSAISVYTKAGFITTDQMKDYYSKPTEDGLEMSCPTQLRKSVNTRFTTLYQPSV